MASKFRKRRWKASRSRKPPQSCLTADQVHCGYCDSVNRVGDCWIALQYVGQPDTDEKSLEADKLQVSLELDRRMPSAQEFLDGLSGEDSRKLERMYRERVGLAPSPLFPEGPVIRPGAEAA